MHRSTLPLLTLLLACPPGHAQDNCEEVRAGIDAKIRAAGVERFTLAVVELAASAPGRVVGNCARGSRKIVYTQGAADAAPAAAASGTRRSGGEKLLTECRDGTVKVGGDCRR